MSVVGKHRVQTRWGDLDALGHVGHTAVFTYLEAGKGPLVLLLHGFPDNAHTWSNQIEPLADAGYRVVAPYLRGYPPTEIPADGRYDLTALANDVHELIGALGGEPAHVIGHDWGAATTYATMAMFPASIGRSDAEVTTTARPATHREISSQSMWWSGLVDPGAMSIRHRHSSVDPRDGAA